jgi:hypothetical protein
MIHPVEARGKSIGDRGFLGGALIFTANADSLVLSDHLGVRGR